METNEILRIMNATIKMVVDYMEEQKRINEEALKPYETNPVLDSDTDTQIKRMRERHAAALRHDIHELNRHIAVIKKMVPPAEALSTVEKLAKNRRK